MRCSHGPSHKHRRHRTTARRGHTPAAHDQSSSSPSLLSLTCSLQHKPTPRQRRAKERHKSHNHRTVPSSNESHAPQQQQLGGRRSTTIKTKRSAPRHCTVPHTPTVTITVIPSPQALTGTPRSLQHTPLQHRPRDRRVLPAHAIRHALPLSPQRTPPPPSAKQLRVLHVPHNRRHATAACNTHSTTISCRLSSTIMSATPNAYWRTCSMHCNHSRIRLAVMHCTFLLSYFCLEQTLHILS
ncbi:hypothetical protein MOQ_008298, partial [Trypanosoma cruzi marinkellei]